MKWNIPHISPEKPLDWDLLERTYSWVADMRGVPQDPYWHAEGDVLTHTKMVVEALVSLQDYQALPTEDRCVLLVAAILHDVEKRSTTLTEVIDGRERIISPRHAKYGEFSARTILYRNLPLPFAIRERIAKLVRYHGLPLWAIEKEDPQKAVITASLEVNTRHLALLCHADVEGRIGENMEELRLKLALFTELCRENDCYGTPRVFATDLAKYWYLHKPAASPDYVPYDDSICEVTILSGLPGSGKDHYLKSQATLPVLSLDDLRRKNNIKHKDKKGNGRVIQAAKEQAKVYLRARQSFVYNATNITRDMRKKWIDLFVSYGAKVRIVYVEVEYRTLLQQNLSREFPVPVKALEQMLGKLEVPATTEAHSIEYFTS